MSARAVGTVLIGNQTVARSDIRRLPECALPLDDASWAVARASLERDGFVLIRGAFDADTIAKCRVAMLAQVRRRGGIDLAAAKERGDPALVACAPIARTADGKRLQAGWTTDALSGRVVDYRDEDEAGWAKVGESAPVQAVFNGPNLCGIAKQLFSNHCNEVAGSIRKASRIELLPQYTWLRMKGRGDVTIEHADYYFFYRSTAAFTGIGSINCPPSPSKDILTCGECSGSVLDHSPHASEVPKSHKASWLQCSLCNHVAFHSQCFEHRQSQQTDSNATCEMVASAGSMSSASSPTSMVTASQGAGMHAMAPDQSSRDVAPSGQPVWHCEQCADGPMPVYTAWVALGPVNASDGTLCFVPGSHRWTGFSTPTPRKAQVPREFTDRLRATKASAAKGKKLGKRKAELESPEAEAAAGQGGDVAPPVQWYSADYRPGDLVVFNVKTVHAASKNLSNSYRLSLDTRFIVHAADDSDGRIISAAAGAKGRRK